MRQVLRFGWVLCFAFFFTAVVTHRADAADAAALRQPRSASRSSATGVP